MADKNLGTTYIEIGASTDKLKAGLQTAKTTTEQTVRGMETEVQRLPAAFSKASAGASNMNMAIGQLGYALGDSSMFMFSFRAGMMSIGNNIPVIVQGLMQAKTAAEASGSSFRSALASSIMGPGGALLAINALMFALQVLPQLLGDTQSAANKFDLDTLANETDDFARAMKELNKQVKDIPTDELDSFFTKLTTRLEETRDKLTSFTDQMSNLTVVSALIGVDLTKLFGDSKYKDFAEKITAISKAIKGIEEQKSSPGIIGRLDADIKSLNEQLTGAKTTEEINKINASLKKLKDQKEALLGKSKGGETPAKDRENDLKQYYDEMKWYAEDYNKFLDDQLSKEIKDLSNTITDKGKLHEYEIQKRKEREDAYQKWLKDNQPGLINRKGIIGDVSAKGTYDSNGFNTMFPIGNEEVRKQKEQSDAGFKNSMKNFEDYKSSVESFSNTLSSGFANAIISGENLGDMFKNLAAQLAGMVIQALAFKAIMSAFDLGSGGAASAIGAIVSGVSNSLSAPLGATGGAIPQSLTNNSFNVNNQFSLSTSGIISGLAKVQNSVDRMTGSLQAMNVNVMSQKPVVVKNYLDGKPMAENSAKYIQQFEQGNIKL